MHRIVTVVGARPQFVKAAMLSNEFIRRETFEEILVHTGQHYDHNMSEAFFKEMGIPQPEFNLQVGSDSHGRQTGRILGQMDKILEEKKPDAVVVYGDTNSTLGGALSAAKLKIPVIHLEAGMRSFDSFQPEEINRVLTDHCSSLLLCSTQSAADNLRKEGISKDIQVVGDLMMDSTLVFSELPSNILEKYELEPEGYLVLTCHRPESTDSPERLAAIVDAILSVDETVLFPVHPRTAKLLREYDLLGALDQSEQVLLINPLTYTDMLNAVKNSRLVITDSGGLQKEAYILNKPCVTIRENTEWEELVRVGWNEVVGYDSKMISHAIRTFTPPSSHPQLFGNGAAAASATAIETFINSKK